MLSAGICHFFPWKCPQTRQTNAIAIRPSSWTNATPASLKRALKTFKLEISASAFSNRRICEEETQQLSLTDRVTPGNLDPDRLSYKESFTIRCYEVGVNRTATIEALANLRQEVACNHVHSMGYSTDGFTTTPSMKKQHLIWVAAQMHIEVYKYPAWYKQKYSRKILCNLKLSRCEMIQTDREVEEVSIKSYPEDTLLRSKGNLLQTTYANIL